MNLIYFVYQSGQKTLLSIGSLFLVFLSTGCVNPLTANVKTQTCQDAQTKVSQVQKEYNEVVNQLARHPQDETKTISTAIVQKLQESQEQALEVCERVD